MEDQSKHDTGSIPVECQVQSLREAVAQEGCALRKWGRMLNALLAILEEKQITCKDDVMAKVYEKLDDSATLECVEDRANSI